MRAKNIVNQSSDFPVRRTGSYRHKKALLVGKTLTNVFHCDIAEIRFVGKLVIIQTYQRIECHLSNTVNLRPLTPHIMPRYTRIMAVVSWP